MARLVLVFELVLAAALVGAQPAVAETADENALAQRHAPVVRLVEQEEECGPGEPYEPIDVEVLFDEPTVALRGPWTRFDLVEIGPGADRLSGLYEYHLDFPGDALDPGCDYERWARRLTEGRAPVAYAHVATEAGRPGWLALQYWFFYAYNDWNNLHEGDWETVQLLFEARTAREALDEQPVAVGYSQHEGTERADWGADKLELVDGTRPVVYPAAGSHANFFNEGLYLGSSASQGVGCDDTRGPHVEIEPTVVTIPSERPARTAFPWISFEGRWGELREAFFNGPTGPNLKRSWVEPITPSDEWRARSYAVPAGGIVGTEATDFFCGAVAAGSLGLIRLVRNPEPTLLAAAALVVLAAVMAGRTAWHPSAPLRVARRRRWGQIVAASARLYVRRAPLFLGIGLLLVPLGLLGSLAQALLVGGLGLAGFDETGAAAGAVALLVVGIGTTLALLGLLLVQAATATAVVAIDAGNAIGPVEAYRRALMKIGPLLVGTGVIVATWLALTSTVLLIPLAVWLAVRWAFLAQAVELEGRRGLAGLRRSRELVRGRWIRVASLVGLGALLALAAGPLVGALLILVTDAPLAVLNLLAAVVYVFVLPLVALITCYVYFDARSRLEHGGSAAHELPAEFDLAPQSDVRRGI